MPKSSFLQTFLSQNPVRTGTLHAVAKTCNKSKSGLEHCMQLHTLATNPSLDWGIFNHADLHYRTAKIRKGRKEGCLQPGGHWTLPLSLSFLLPFAALRLPVSSPQLPASSPLPAAPAHRSSVGPVGDKECKMCVKTKKIYPQWHGSPIMSPPVTLCV